jgi:hypothetical protein
VTFQMNQLRQAGFLRYSRRGIQVYADALREHLNRPQTRGRDLYATSRS